MIEYKFTCDRCGLELEEEDLNISNLAPLPTGWRRITFSFPAAKDGEETSLFGDHFEEEPSCEFCPDCVRLIRKIMRDVELRLDILSKEHYNDLLQQLEVERQQVIESRNPKSEQSQK